MDNSKPYIHPSAIVSSLKIGNGTRIWAFVHVLEGAQIGENCNICDHCFIENDVVIGDNVTVKCGVYLWDKTRIENKVMVGPNVVFTNDLRPRSKFHDKEFYPVIVKEGASLGANSTLLAGVIIGKYAMTGIGSVVTKNVPNHALVYGNPAIQHGWVDFEGNKLTKFKKSLWMSLNGTIFAEDKDGLKEFIKLK
jgi:acetyltransferase-like isoleucine patch superfamily enzyme